MNAVTDEFGGDVRFETIEFCVDGDGRNANFVFVAFVGMIDAGRAPEHDFDISVMRVEKSKVRSYCFSAVSENSLSSCSAGRSR